MKLKRNVKLTDLKPQTVLGMAIAGAVVTFTSVDDSTHGAGSLHGDGYAFDCRTKDFAGDKHALVAALKDALGPDFDVVLEDLGGANEHIHVEYDPK